MACRNGRAKNAALLEKLNAADYPTRTMWKSSRSWLHAGRRDGRNTK